MYIRFLTMSPYLCLPGALKTRINCSLSNKRKKKEEVTKPPCRNKRTEAVAMQLTAS